MSSCLFPALDLFEDTAIGMYFAGYLQLKHFPFFPCLLLMILSINQIIPAPPPPNNFQTDWFPNLVPISPDQECDKDDEGEYC